MCEILTEQDAVVCDTLAEQDAVMCDILKSKVQYCVRYRRNRMQ